jgi:amino-acid N-acetyltransferase
MKDTDSKIAVRAAEFRDAAQISALIKQYPEELLQRPIGDIVQNIDRFLVCESDEKIVGTVSWQIMPEIGIPTKPSVEIKSLAILSDLRGKGIGKALVTATMAHIKLLHPRQIIALTFTPGFFASLGFKETPKAELMHKIYSGCINCVKYDSPFTCPEQAMTYDCE